MRRKIRKKATGSSPSSYLKISSDHEKNLNIAVDAFGLDTSGPGAEYLLKKALRLLDLADKQCAAAALERLGQYTGERTDLPDNVKELLAQIMSWKGKEEPVSSSQKKPAESPKKAVAPRPVRVVGQPEKPVALKPKPAEEGNFESVIINGLFEGKYEHALTNGTSTHSHESEVLAAYQELQSVRKRHDMLNKEYWRIVESHNKNGNGKIQLGFAVVADAYQSLCKALDAVRLKEKNYETILDMLALTSGEKKDDLEKRLLGESVYKKEIENRLANAREDRIRALEKNDRESIAKAEAEIGKYENILQGFVKKPKWQDGITGTDYSIEKPTFVPSVQQEELEKEAVKKFSEAKKKNEEGIRLEEYIKNGGTIKPMYQTKLNSRILARLSYKKALDRLSEEYNAAPERVHDLVEKRARYEETLLKATSVFAVELNDRSMSYIHILDLGEHVIASGKYNPNLANPRDKCSAELYHASLELDCARELLVKAPMQTINMENGTVHLRRNTMQGSNTMYWFNDMVTHVHSAPPSPEQLERMAELRQNAEHQKNKKLNGIIWEIMSEHFLDEGSHRPCPVVVTIPKDLTLLYGDGVYTFSHYVAIRENPELDDDTRKSVIAHEQAHYLAALNGGLGEVTEDGKMDFTLYLGNKRIKGAAWLHEGLTELHSQQLIRKFGILSKKIGYPKEVKFCLYLQKLVGEDILKKAYLSGDFTKVRDKLDSELGYGTFEEIIMKQMVLFAFDVLVKPLVHLGIDFQSWETDEIVALAKKQLAERNRSRKENPP